MKALINGINVEGTPQEIAEYQRIVNVKEQPYKYDSPAINPIPYVLYPEVTCDSITYVWNGPVPSVTLR